MKSFYYMGPNSENTSRVSWKMWKIERKGCEVTAWWGPATIVKRKVTKTAKLRTKTWKFRTEAAAKADEERRIQSKLSSGYSQTLR